MCLSIGQAKELLKAHDQRPPFVGVDPVWIAVGEDGGLYKNALNAQFEKDAAASECRIAVGHVVSVLNDRFHLDRTFLGARWVDRLRRNRSEPCRPEFILLEA